MSYDVGTDTGVWINYTSNLWGAWEAAGAHIREWDGKTAREVLPELVRAIDEIRACPERFRQYEPDNGWGDVDSMVATFLIPLRVAFESEPDAVIWVSQ